MVCKELLADLDFALIKFKSLSAGDQRKLRERPDEQSSAARHQDQDRSRTRVLHLRRAGCHQPGLQKQINTMVVFDLGLQGLDKGGRNDIQMMVRLANVLLCREIAKSHRCGR